MTKQDFIEFIKELGFNQTWQEKPDHFDLRVSSSDYDFLNISIYDDELEMFQLQGSKMWSNMASGRNFGNFSLKKFGDKNDLQLEIFMSFIIGSFDKVPLAITQYMRDKKIENILNANL